MSTTANTDVALMLLQLIALTIPPTVVLIEQLRRSENLEWQLRKVSFALVLSSVLLLIAAAIGVLAYFVTAVGLSTAIYAALLLVVLGLVPLGAFVVVLYREHRLEHGP
ncbi:hypothetical protein [Halosolutus gelatinilyticus]|uniref:hypothetical protein n=1 Tax=Halosolutus gelatinilyticus TaxID=2931975 RepID=UPI001FF0F976|nr:hypothetical protein [Halosolutus gelatinilyticus]